MRSIPLVGEEYLSQNSDYDVEYYPNRGRVPIPEFRVRCWVSPLAGEELACQPLRPPLAGGRGREERPPRGLGSPRAAPGEPPAITRAKTSGLRVVPLQGTGRSPRGALARGERQRAGDLAPAPSVAFWRAGPKGPGGPPAARTHPIGFVGGGWDFRV